MDWWLPPQSGRSSSDCREWSAWRGLPGGPPRFRLRPSPRRKPEGGSRNPFEVRLRVSSVLIASRRVSAVPLHPPLVPASRAARARMMAGDGTLKSGLATRAVQMDARERPHMRAISASGRLAVRGSPSSRCAWLRRSAWVDPMVSTGLVVVSSSGMAARTFAVVDRARAVWPAPVASPPGTTAPSCAALRGDQQPGRRRREAVERVRFPQNGEIAPAQVSRFPPIGEMLPKSRSGRRAVGGCKPKPSKFLILNEFK